MPLGFVWIDIFSDISSICNRSVKVDTHLSEIYLKPEVSELSLEIKENCLEMKKLTSSAFSLKSVTKRFL